MKNIAIIVDKFNPTDGGGYTLQEEILKELANKKLNKKKLFVLYNGKDKTIEYLTQNKFVVIYYNNQVKIDFLKILLKNILPLNFNTVLDKQLNRLEIEFAIFIGSSSCHINKKYIATCWDLMHLTDSKFDEFRNIKNWLNRYLNNKFTYKNAYKIITGTKIGKIDLKKFYKVKDEQIEKIPHPTPSFFENKSRIDKSINKEFIFYPAQFWQHKNHKLLIELMRIIKDKSLNLKLILVGSDKGALNEIKMQIKRYKLRGMIEIKGFVSKKTILNFYRNAFALVYPSFCGPENLPPLEAMASKCPVIVSDIPGHREQLGSSALYANPNNADSFYKQISKLNSNKFRKVLTQRGLKRAKSFKTKNYVDKMIDLIS